MDTPPAEKTDKPKGSQNFSFQGFMEKMRDPQAAGIVQDLKSFITSIWELPVVTDVSVISQMVHDFYSKMENMLENHVLFENADLAERINTIEGIEKYLLTKIYERVFGSRGEADIKEDNALLRKFAGLGFIEPSHLDIPENHVQSSTLRVAEGELLKVNMYKSPRDKLTCISNCCVVLGKILNLTKSGEHGADEFLPLLIYTLIHANPPRLKSNIEYITLFRNPSRLIGENSYFFTNLTSGVHFIENLKATDLTIDANEYERLHTEFLNHFDLRQLVAPSRISSETANFNPLPSMTSENDAELTSEMVNALKKYVDVNFNELRVGDVEGLFDCYKGLAAVCDKLILRSKLNKEGV